MINDCKIIKNQEFLCFVDNLFRIVYPSIFKKFNSTRLRQYSEGSLVKAERVDARRHDFSRLSKMAITFVPMNGF